MEATNFSEQVGVGNVYYSLTLYVSKYCSVFFFSEKHSGWTRLTLQTTMISESA